MRAFVTFLAVCAALLWPQAYSEVNGWDHCTFQILAASAASCQS